MTDAVAAIIIPLSSALGAVAVSWHTAYVRRAEKELDWKRQDEVARQLLVRDVEAKAERANLASLVIQSTEQVTAATQTTNKQLGTIHTLVNSKMTESMQGELNAVLRELALKKEIISLKAAAGEAPNQSALDALAATEAVIADLQVRLTDRARQAKLVGVDPPHGQVP